MARLEIRVVCGGSLTSRHANHLSVPHAQDNVVAYFESASKRGHRRPVADLGLGMLGTMQPLPGAGPGAHGVGVGVGTGVPVVDDFQGALHSPYVAPYLGALSI